MPPPSPTHPGPTAEAPRDEALERRARRRLKAADVARARAHLEATDGRTLAEQAELSEIPAPPFGEEARARRLGALMVDAGLEEVRIDAAGNVLGELPGRAGGGALILSAHLDTVFPPGTDVRVTREESRLAGPGISDDARGLAALLALARALVVSEIDPGVPILLVGTVGEEGEGDLRGVRHLFREGGEGRTARGFVSLDGAGIHRLVTGGVGSRRYRITARGPGGHSWVNWGTPNPIHALGRLVTELTALELPDATPTTLTVARWSGGTSVNAIPEEAWVDVEVRSEAPTVLDDLDGRIRKAAAEAVARTNLAAPDGTGEVRASVTSIGDRPAGATPTSAPLVRAALAATRALGATPELAVSSTDANLPMTLGIPALTMGAGGEAGQAHTTQEWYRNTEGPKGILRALMTALLLVEAGG